MNPMLRPLAVATALLLALPFTGMAQTPANEIPEHFEARDSRFDYVREEVMIPMRDGVRLHTVIWRPKGATGPMPIVLTRTPYDAGNRPAWSQRPNSPRAVAAVPMPDAPLLANGYIRVYQDVRGKYGSEGGYVMNLPPRGPLNAGPVDQATDAWDSIDWLVKNIPDNNGRVGMIGVSYEGWTTLMALLDPHPALKAALPMNAMVDGWIGDDWYHNGALRQFSLEYVYRQATVKGSSEFPMGSRDTYAAYLAAGSANDMARLHGIDQLPTWKKVIDHPAYDDFWQAQALDKLLAARKNTVPTLSVHGLWDQEDIYGPIAAYQALERSDPRNDHNFLVIGPWFHGQQDPWFHGHDGSSIGPIPLGSDTTQTFLQDMMLPFFERFLKSREDIAIPPVRAFRTGTNAWQQLDAWPSQPHTQRLYLQAGGVLGVAAGSAGSHDEYLSDPAKPVPYRVQPIVPNALPDNTWDTWLVDDQRPFTSRPDVLTYTSAPLVEPLTLSGEVIARLTASTSGSDSDWVVKLIDVYPDEDPMHPQLGGYQLMVSGDILRGRYRRSFEQAEAIKPGAPLPYRIRMPQVNHTFRPGHRIMVQVQSSWFPLYDRNPQKFVENVAYAVPGDYRKALQRVFHDSYLELPVATGKLP